MKLRDAMSKYGTAAVVVIAALLRAFYIYYTPTWLRQHDVIGFGADEGQAPFIEYFYQGHLLIDFDPRERWGFFQPPLHHMLAAAWIHLQELIGIGYDKACEHVQVLTLLYSLVTLLFSYMIFRYFKLQHMSLMLAMTVAAIHPDFILMAGSVNNDMLAIMLTVIAIYLGLRWKDDPSWGYTVGLAFAMGLGMMTKLSVGLVAPAIALIFIVRWIQGGQGKFASYLVKYIVFTLICAPIALWSPIRNLVRFGVPINYTPEVGEGISEGLAARIFDIRTTIPFVSRISNGEPYDEFNILLGMMKTSLFGDQNFAHALAEAGHDGRLYDAMIAMGWLLLASGIVLALICLYATARVLASRRYITDAIARAYLLAIYLVSLLMYINFMISASYYSSMDFRYVLYLVPVEALMLGLYWEQGSKPFKTMSVVTTLLFFISTVMVYTMLRFAS